MIALASTFSCCRLVFKTFGNSAMVSLRRRRLLGLCSGGSSFVTPLPQTVTPVSSFPSAKSVNVQSVWSGDANLSDERIFAMWGDSPKEEQQSQAYPDQPIKRRKRHRRKHVQNQEPCVMRGVYFKNMKWQAAIKVDKKQIHLGTVGSQEEAARLYDRAAFMCGREPNFDISEEEKEELRKFKWDEFLAITRSAINNKKHKRGMRRIGGGVAVQNISSEQEMQVGLSGSEEGQADDSSAA
ncbi:Ethylene-responsive transcription factor-like protein At4g13040 [Linum grandiflorum]